MKPLGCPRYGSSLGYSPALVGPTIQPSRRVSSRTVSSGSVVRNFLYGREPINPYLSRTLKPVCFAAAFSTLTVASVISGPMPSPSSTARSISCFAIVLLQLGFVVGQNTTACRRHKTQGTRDKEQKSPLCLVSCVLPRRRLRSKHEQRSKRGEAEPRRHPDDIHADRIEHEPEENGRERLSRARRSAEQTVPGSVAV